MLNDLIILPDTTITKRPLLRPAIPSPYAGHAAPKVIFLGSRTPFVSALKRVRSLLNHVDKRGTQAALARSSGGRRGGRGRGRGGPGGRGSQSRDVERDRRRLEEIEQEPVFVKATGKAVEKALGLAAVMMKQKEWKVVLRTGSVCAIDDLAAGDEEHPIAGEKDDDEGESMQVDPQAEEGEDSNGDKQVAAMVDNDDDDKLPETRIRYTSMIEIEVRLRGETAAV